MNFDVIGEASLFLRALFFFLLLIFTVYGVLLCYHWYTFGTSRRTSSVALAVYLCGGAVLFLTLAGGIRLL